MSEKTQILIDGKVIGKCHRVRLSEDFFQDKTVYQYHVEGFEQPTLSDNQQIVLKWLKENKMDNLFLTTARLHRGFLSGGVTSQVKSACGVLDLQQQAQVLQEFGKWALEQEEDDEI